MAKTGNTSSSVMYAYLYIKYQELLPQNTYHFDILATSVSGVSVKQVPIVKLRQGSGKDRQGMAVKVKGLKA